MKRIRSQLGDAFGVGAGGEGREDAEGSSGERDDVLRAADHERGE